MYCNSPRQDLQPFSNISNGLTSPMHHSCLPDRELSYAESRDVDWQFSHEAQLHEAFAFHDCGFLFVFWIVFFVLEPISSRFYAKILVKFLYKKMYCTEIFCTIRFFIVYSNCESKEMARIVLSAEKTASSLRSFFSPPLASCFTKSAFCVTSSASSLITALASLS